MAGAVDPASVWRARVIPDNQRIQMGQVGQGIRGIHEDWTSSAMDHGLEAPFGQLSECHRRIEGFLTVLLTVADSRRGGTLAEGDREILTAGLHYFRTITPRHSADEEQSIFARLRSSADPHARAAI